jgi:hypothetical protein
MQSKSTQQESKFNAKQINAVELAATPTKAKPSNKS